MLNCSCISVGCQNAKKLHLAVFDFSRPLCLDDVTACSAYPNIAMIALQSTNNAQKLYSPVHLYWLPGARKHLAVSHFKLVPEPHPLSIEASCIQRSNQIIKLSLHEWPPVKPASAPDSHSPLVKKWEMYPLIFRNFRKCVNLNMGRLCDRNNCIGL